MQERSYDLSISSLKFENVSLLKRQLIFSVETSYTGSHHKNSNYVFLLQLSTHTVFITHKYNHANKFGRTFTSSCIIYLSSILLTIDLVTKIIYRKSFKVYLKWILMIASKLYCTSTTLKSVQQLLCMFIHLLFDYGTRLKAAGWDENCVYAWL